MKEVISVIVVLVIVGAAVDHFGKKDPPKPDPRDAQIEQLRQEIEQLKNQPKPHHYELRAEGFRTWRFDPDTGDTCIQLTTQEDWKKRSTMEESCQYEDFVGSDYSLQHLNAASCLFLNDKNACSASNQK